MAVLLAGLVGSAIVWAAASDWRARNVSEAQAQFRNTSSDLSSELGRTLDQYADLVSGSAALFHLRVLSRAEYVAYLRSVGFGSQRFAGLDGLGLVQRVPASQVRSFFAALREEGVAAPSLAPPGQRSQYCLGSYAAWRNLSSSVPLYGYDFCTVPSISQVLGRATRSGQQQVLAGSALGPAYASDFLLVQPVYAGSPISKAQREHQVSGWALGIINGPALLKSMPRQIGVQFLVFSGTGPARSAEPILRSPSMVKLNGAWALSDEIDSDGTWDIRFRAAPGTAPPDNGSGPVVLLAVGLLAVALLVALLGSLLTSRRRAVRAVDRATRSLRSTEERFRALVRNSSDLIAVLDQNARLFYASPRVLAFVPSEQMGRNLLDVVHPDDREAVARLFSEHLLQPGVHDPSTFRLQTASGDWRVLDVVATNCLDDPAVAGIVMNARDVTERTNLTRALRTLAKSNRVLVDALDESSLLFGTCQTVVEAGSYRLAWVGYAEADGAHTVRPVAWAGLAGYVDEITVTWGDEPHGRGPTGTSIRTRTVQVVDDVDRAGAFAPWLANADKFGLRSSCALPLEANGEVIGALSIYAAEPGVFGPDEVGLLSELAGALAYGIGRLRDAASLQASEERFRTLAGAAPIGILEVSPDASVSYANPRMVEIVAARDVEALLGRGWIDSVRPEDVRELLSLFQRASRARSQVATTFKVQLPNGKARHVRMLAAPKALNQDVGYVVTVEDITEETRAREALTHQAFYDALTGLPNRALFVDRLGQELARCRRDGSDIAVLFLDLDRFKIVNDSLGHETGDAVLKEVGDRFTRAVRAGETAARFSGDSFVFMIRDIQQAQGAVVAAQRLQALLEPPIKCDGRDLIVTGSIGIVIPDARADGPTVLRDAEAAMYKAKEEGRNRSALFDEALHRRSVTRLTLEGELRQALARDEFQVYYQPLVEPASGRLLGAEALIRWHHPGRGLVPPLEFIPVAEDSGLIKPLGRWVFEQALSQLAVWDTQDYSVRLAELAVNLSARQLDDPETPDIVQYLLQRHGIASSRVCVELTESVVMADSVSTRRSLEAFRNLGLRVAIDDFGTGYSSLAYLHTLPVTTVKIDRSFIERLGGADDSTPVVRAVVEMSHAMGLRVVAEGVSNRRLGALVTGIGCDAAQGFYWARPMPAGEFEAWKREAKGPALALPTART